MTITIGGLVLLGATQFTSGQRLEAYHQSLMIAEAGIQYYRWHLAHDPTDFSDGPNGADGSYSHDYSDPQSGINGTFTLNITPPQTGSTIATITSTGSTTTHPEIKRTVSVLFGIPSLARFSFLHNANVWFGSGLTIYGRVMSNGGIRQDGINTSTVQSAKETYTCGTETGCWPAQEQAGVWGSGGPSELWQFPVSPVDFNSISIDFSTMRDAAQTEGVYLGPSGNRGYHFLFKDNGTVEIYRVTNAQTRRGYSDENGCETLFQRILQETLIGTYNLNDKKIYFAEDIIWVEGVVNGRATVVAARFPIDTFETNIWIPGNIVYVAKNGDHGLGLIAQHDIYYTLDVPTNFEIDAAILAQNGKVIRHNYSQTGCSNFGTAVKEKLVLFGSLISNKKSYWNYGSGPDSGFINREITYDNDLYLKPPPYFPTTGDYEIITWDEVNNP